MVIDFKHRSRSSNSLRRNHSTPSTRVTHPVFCSEAHRALISNGAQTFTTIEIRANVKAVLISLNSINSVGGGNNENSVNSVQTVLPPSLMVFLFRAPELAFLGMK